MARSISMMGVVMAILFFSAIVTAQTSKSLRVGGHEEVHGTEMNSFKLEGINLNSYSFGTTIGQCGPSSSTSFPYAAFYPFYPTTCYARATPKPLDQIGLGSNCKESGEMSVIVVWQDDVSQSAKNALMGDVKNSAAQAEIQFFFRKFVYETVSAMTHTRDIWSKEASKNCAASDIPDCNVGVANMLAQSAGVKFSYDSRKNALKAEFKIRACIALMAELTKCKSPVKSAAGLQQSLNVGMFCAGTSNVNCDVMLQTITDTAAASVSAQSSAFVKLLKLPSPRLLKEGEHAEGEEEGVQRELSKVAAKKPKIIGILSGKAATVKGG